MATDADFKIKHGLVVTEDIELGHATDTTIARSSAGVITVEGVVVPTISSTNTLTNKTLTSPVLTGLIDTTLTSGSEQVLISDTSDTTLFKVVQLGTGNAFEVHDQATDSSAFFANNAGKVGILKNPGSGLTYDVEIGGETLSERFTSSVSGSVGSPAFRFSSDDNNGMYLGGTDILGFSTAGTERMTISASGVVNIAGSLTVAGSAVGGASALNGLTDVISNITNFTDSILISPDGAAPPHGTLSSAVDNIGIGKDALKVITSGVRNTVIGNYAGDALTQSTGCTFIGMEAGSAIVDSGYSTALGYQAHQLHTGGNNVALGYRALYQAGSGNSHIAIGNSAMAAAVTSNSSIAIGKSALQNMTSGATNIGIGQEAQMMQTTGDRNISIGYQTIRGYPNGSAYSDNMAIGHQSMYGDGTSTSAGVSGADNLGLGNYTLGMLTSGNRNIAIGKNAGDAINDEDDNIAIGISALGGAVDGGEQNLAIGNYALDALTEGDKNVAVGHNAGTGITEGHYNVGMGVEAMEKLTTGDNNVAIGYQALEENTTGDNNIAIGWRSLDGNTASNANIAIGYSALGSSSLSGGLNIAIGYGAGDNITSGANNVVIGGADVTATSSDQLSISSGDGDPVWITGDSTGAIAMNHKADVIAVSSSTTTLTLGQTGSYVYWTGGDVTLPASGTVGTQYTIINDTGSSDSVTLNASNCAMATGFTNAAIADHELASFVCVTANTWIQVG